MAFRPISITGLLCGCLAAILLCSAGAVGWAWLAVVSAQSAARDANLSAIAAGVAQTLDPSGGIPIDGSPEWKGQISQVIARRGVTPAVVVQVYTPTEVSGQWRLAVAQPERPEADLPQRDAAVAEALQQQTGHGATVTWFDASGSGWRSHVMIRRDQRGHPIALVEARQGVQVPGLTDRVVVLGLLLAAMSIGVVGSLVVLARIRLALAVLRSGIADLGRGDSTRGGPGENRPMEPVLQQSRELGSLAGSLQLAEGEQTTRRLRLKREIADLRVQVARYQGADRTKTTLLVALCRSLRSAVDSLRSAGTLLGQTRLDRTQREYVDSVHAGCGDLLTRISDVLDFALLEAECLSLDQRPLRPRLVLEEAMLIVAERCALLPIELAWHADPTVPERVIGDLPRVRQVLVNLIGLAASTAEEGTVEVHMLAEADDRLTFRITLMGVTLTAERIRLLLDGAISSDSSSDGLQGEGLGLVLGKRLAQAMGGSLLIERGESDDIELVCTLRVTPDDVAPERPFLHRRVIVGHERPATSRMLVGLLKRAGAEVETVSTRMELSALLARSSEPCGALVLSTRLMATEESGDALEVIAGINAMTGAGQSVAVPLVVVVDPAHRGHLSELRAAGATGLLATPVRQQQLFSVVGDALSGIRRDTSQVRAITTSLDRPPRVLVVEDNHVNQLVLVRMMESLGIRPELADNGLQAVELLRSAVDEPYALILMDVMMPVMDGIDATRAIRQEQEQEPPVWIIAVTANALANDRIRCLDAGMNDYLPKPVTPLALSSAISRWRQATGRANNRSSGRIVALTGATLAADPSMPSVNTLFRPAVPGVDFSGLKTLVRLAGRQAVIDVIECFLREVHGLRTGVQTALDDGPRLRAAAHKLKGSSGTVGLRSLEAQAAAIEVAAKADNLSLAAEQVALLPEIFAFSVDQLTAFRDEC